MYGSVIKCMSYMNVWQCNKVYVLYECMAECMGIPRGSSADVYYASGCSTHETQFYLRIPLV